MKRKMPHSVWYEKKTLVRFIEKHTLLLFVSIIRFSMRKIYLPLLCWIFLAFILPERTMCFAESPSKTIVLTCATGELGTALAKKLIEDFHLILTGRSLSKLEALQTELNAQFPGCCDTCLLDFSDSSSLTHFKKILHEKHIPLSGLVLMTPRPNFQKSVLQEEAEWLQSLQSTFTGPLEALKATLPHMPKESKIVIIAGTTSIQAMPEYGPSCIIRRMWATCGKLLAHQLGPQGISVNLLSPGVVLTDFHRRRIENKANIHAQSYEDEMAQEVSNIPLRRHATPSEVARAVHFLLSDSANFITGVNLLIDGGITVGY